MDLDALARVFGRPRGAAPDRPADGALGNPTGPPAASLEAVREAREERAAILEFEAGLTRAAAEALAARLHPDPRTTRPGPQPTQPRNDHDDEHD